MTIPSAIDRRYDLPITRPVLGSEEAVAVQEVLESGWIVQGPRVAEFERRFAAYTGSRHAVATTSCTTALHLAVRALGLGPGDEVIVPAFTWVSTANVVEYQGARPVFCDIDLPTFNINPASIERLITDRTVGIVPVHLFGLCAEMDRINDLALRHGLWVVEDAACGFGARIGPRHAGTFGQAGCFSFHPRKSITTGEGGMLTTADGDLSERCRSLRDHGASRTDHERHHARASYLLADYPEVGYNYRMTDIQAAVGCVQMDRADTILQARRSVAAEYDERLRDINWIAPPVTPPGFTHGYQSYVTLFRPEAPSLGNVDELRARRNRIMEALEAVGIATRQGTHAPIRLAAYRDRYGLREEDYPNALMAESLSLSLPLSFHMTAAEVDVVVDGLQRSYA